MQYTFIFSIRTCLVFLYFISVFVKVLYSACKRESLLSALFFALLCYYNGLSRYYFVSIFLFYGIQKVAELQEVSELATSMGFLCT